MTVLVDVGGALYANIDRGYVDHDALSSLEATLGNDPLLRDVCRQSSDQLIPVLHGVGFRVSIPFRPRLADSLARRPDRS